MKLEQLFPLEDVQEAQRAAKLDSIFLSQQFTALELRDSYYTARYRRLREERRKNRHIVTRGMIEEDKEKQRNQPRDPTPDELEAFIRELTAN